MQTSRKIHRKMEVLVVICALSGVMLSGCSSTRTINAQEIPKGAWQDSTMKNFNYLLFVQHVSYDFRDHKVIRYQTINGAISDISYFDHFSRRVVQCYLSQSVDADHNTVSLIHNQSKGEFPCRGTLYQLSAREWRVYR